MIIKLFPVKEIKGIKTVLSYTIRQSQLHNYQEKNSITFQNVHKTFRQSNTKYNIVISYFFKFYNCKHRVSIH